MRRLSTADRVLEVTEWIRTGEARERRIRSGLSQSEVAASCDASPTAVLRWERGERRPRGRYAVAYHKVLEQLGARELA
ncbi:MAG TPA: helix-turn-helix domain-containing protein [Actinocrinis sp.]|uniref:helix-turn-helix domain-containing protein n=1 Tax=Actinocrinis sp. TaxID=1920516 RepID=UPI002D4FD761|nr:helix-turn-helix domain-containing protein [Actinocrinis sp.]HZU54822.1 helix-turn-helix domain-containing protein [Actinocrinis sp.]